MLGWCSESLKITYVLQHTTLAKKVQIQGGVPCQSGNPQPLQVTIHRLQETLHTLHPGQYSQASRHFEAIVTIPTSGKIFLRQLFQWHHCYWHAATYTTTLFTVMQHSILPASITSIQGIHNVVALQVHIMCQDSQGLHLKCFLWQTNKAMCCHFKPNPVPTTNQHVCVHHLCFSAYTCMPP